VYALALRKGERSPFEPDDELHPPKKDEAKGPAKEQAGDEKPAPAKDAKKDVQKGGTKDTAQAAKPDEAAKPVPRVEIDLDGIEARIVEVPVPPGNYSDLSVDGKRLYYVSRDAGRNAKRVLKTFPIDNKKPEAETFAEDITFSELSQDGKKLLLGKAKDFYVLDAAAKAPAASELARRQVPLKDWTFRLDPREEWAQMYQEAWRLERDYFYDRGMHGLDWPAIKARFQPLEGLIIDVATTTAGTSTAGCWGGCSARRGSTGSRASAAQPGTCSTPSAATWSSCATSQPRLTARRSPRASAASASAS